jgi:hypothetical protein
MGVSLVSGGQSMQCGGVWCIALLPVGRGLFFRACLFHFWTTATAAFAERRTMAQGATMIPSLQLNIALERSLMNYCRANGP